MAMISRDTPVGYELDGVKKKMVIQLMGSRHWGRTNPLHWDPAYAAERGLKAPIATGQMSVAYLAETCVNAFGENFFRKARLGGKYVKPVFAGEVITTHGIIREKIPEGAGFRFKIELWTDNQDGEVKTKAWAEVHVE